MPQQNDLTATTYFYERLRAVASGIMESAATTFLLLIAVRWFEAGSVHKALLAGASSLGFIFAPFAVKFTETRSMRPTNACAFFFALSGLAFLVCSLVPHLNTFVLCGVFAIMLVSMCTPLIVQMYQENYPSKNRGKLLSGSVMIRIAVATIFSQIAGVALDGRLQYYQFLMALFCLASFFGSFCIAACPSKNMRPSSYSNPLHGLRYIRSDKLFRNTLVCWMLMGFANLMMIPLRIEYLANPEYGLNLSVSSIALLVAVVPNAARFFLSPVWGRLFDKMNFFALRIVLNFGFMLGIAAFFTSTSFPGLFLGSIIYGISNAGGDIAWNLWVTKFAPHDKVADYMAVHTFLTGVRGIIAPFAAFHLLAYFSPASLGFGNSLLIIIASLILIPEFKIERNRRQQLAKEGYLESL